MKVTKVLLLHLLLHTMQVSCPYIGNQKTCNVNKMHSTKTSPDNIEPTIHMGPNIYQHPDKIDITTTLSENTYIEGSTLETINYTKTRLVDFVKNNT